MAETLGSLCDKLTIVKLKQWHSSDSRRLESLAQQEKQLSDEIDDFVHLAVSGRIPTSRMSFSANKVYKEEGNPVRNFTGTIGVVFSELAFVNCKIWHTQEKVYEFDRVPADQKDSVIRSLGILNLERNNCIESIDQAFSKLIRDIVR